MIFWIFYNLRGEKCRSSPTQRAVLLTSVSVLQFCAITGTIAGTIAGTRTVSTVAGTVQQTVFFVYYFVQQSDKLLVVVSPEFSVVMVTVMTLLCVVMTTNFVT